MIQQASLSPGVYISHCSIVCKTSCILSWLVCVLIHRLVIYSILLCMKYTILSGSHIPATWTGSSIRDICMTTLTFQVSNIYVYGSLIQFINQQWYKSAQNVYVRLQVYDQTRIKEHCKIYIPMKILEINCWWFV